MGEVIKAYKGFNKDMTCRDFQYEEGKEYEEERAETCSCRLGSRSNGKRSKRIHTCSCGMETDR